MTLTYINYLNAFGSAILTGLIVFTLFCFADSHNPAQRIGLGLAGAATLLSIGRQLGLREVMMPFEGWYQMLWRVGWILFLAGLVARHVFHRRANLQAIAAAAEHLDARHISRRPL